MADRLRTDDRLGPGDAISSPDGRFVLRMQTDGNLVLYAPGNNAMWDSGTDTPGSVVVMQGDGNLVVYAPGNRAVWSSKSSGSQCVLILQDDGNLVIYAAGNRAVWSTGTSAPTQKSVKFDRDGMEFSVKVSRTGIIETERFAGIKKQSGIYHHYFWLCLLDSNDDTLWAGEIPLKLTIGAANDTLGRPSYVSKRERHVFTVSLPGDKFDAVARAGAVLMRQEGGDGSLLDQVLRLDAIYKKLKDTDLVKDAIMVAKAIAANG